MKKTSFIIITVFLTALIFFDLLNLISYWCILLSYGFFVGFTSMLLLFLSLVLFKCNFYLNFRHSLLQGIIIYVVVLVFLDLPIFEQGYTMIEKGLGTILGICFGIISAYRIAAWFETKKSQSRDRYSGGHRIL